jgi:hypothetical protein
MSSTEKGRKREEDAEKSSGAAKPVSLSPLSFEESIDAIFAVPPPPKDEPKEAKKRAVKKAAKK